MADDRQRFAPIEPDLGALALFPSELETAGGRARSASSGKGVAAKADFPVNRPPAKPTVSSPPTGRAGQPRSVSARSETAQPRPVLPMRRDLATSDRSTGRFWLTTVAAVAGLGAILFILRPELLRSSLAGAYRWAAAAVESSPQESSEPAPPAATSEAAHPSPSASTPQSYSPTRATPVRQPTGRGAVTPRLEGRRSSARTPIDQPVKGLSPVNSAATAVNRMRFQGSLSVDSQIPGAQVFIGGKPAGVTPLVDWQLTAGSHVVRLELDGYERWSTVVQVASGKTVNLVVNLRPVDRD
jgi:hypothetical protein